MCLCGKRSDDLLDTGTEDPPAAFVVVDDSREVAQQVGCVVKHLGG